ncbi:RluA family pseudouridine synthase [Tuberibacillus sp. Marseille-P3662]|uniref:RluA family pseudouridine synthase n=1 Tax=Tuberibacillus sp. Marseille-P3662 TaxID=1965358 RepID=UPI000A1CE1E8|nr:RluA family pseudouridine synthase [Tuberibacillus sp. Marseille-P3662]
MEPYTLKQVIQDAADGVLLRTYLFDHLKLSRRLVKSIKFGGQFFINGQPATVRYRITTGDELVIKFPPEHTSDTLMARSMPLDIKYEDDDALVINKPPDLPVIPSFQYPNGTLANGVLAYLQGQHLPYTVHTVTRLDRDTSGLILIAKHRYAHERFFHMQHSKAIEREYLAVAEGHLQAVEGVIDAPIGREEGSIIKRCVREDGKWARTHYKVVKRLAGMDVVTIRLETGRTHQIRVHFAHIGHPLAGDDLYGGSLTRIHRQALHSQHLSFKHPLTEETIVVSAPPSPDIHGIIQHSSSI